MENANVSIVKGELTFEDKVIQKIIGIALEAVSYTHLSFYRRGFMKGLSKKKRVSTWLALGITVVSCFALSGEVQASVERTKVDEFANVLDCLLYTSRCV